MKHYLCFSFLLIFLQLSLVNAQEMLKVSHYYVPVYKTMDTKSKMQGNLLKGQIALKVKEEKDWVQINAFKGLLIGWAESKYFENTSQSGQNTIEIDAKKISPTYPGKAQMQKSMKASNPHQGPYRGVQYCVQCHHPEAPSSIPGQGKPIEIWSNSAHANAFHTLFTGKALKVAEKLGIKQPFKSEKCLKCHITAYGAPKNEAEEIAYTEGVGCEACHGPGGSLHGSKGEWDVSQIENRRQFCEKCHNAQSPTFNDFNLEAFSQYIAHWKHDNEVNQIRIDEQKKAIAQNEADIKKDKSIPKIELSAPIIHEPEPKANIVEEKKTHDSKPVSEGILVLHSGVGKPVHFPHQKHQKDFGLECKSCHHIPGEFKCRSCHNDTSEVTRKTAFHDGSRACRNCHREMANKGFDAPRTCSGCHIE